MLNKKGHYKLNLEGIQYDIIDTSSFMLHAIFSQYFFTLSQWLFTSLTYLIWFKVYVLGVGLQHECSFYFFYYWYSMFYAKHYHLLVYYNEQQIYLATLLSALIFQCINSLNIAQFVVKMRSNKSQNETFQKKNLWVRGFFP